MNLCDEVALLRLLLDFGLNCKRNSYGNRMCLWSNAALCRSVEICGIFIVSPPEQAVLYTDLSSFQGAQSQRNIA